MEPSDPSTLLIRTGRSPHAQRPRPARTARPGGRGARARLLRRRREARHDPVRRLALGALQRGQDRRRSLRAGQTRRDPDARREPGRRSRPAGAPAPRHPGGRGARGRARSGGRHGGGAAADRRVPQRRTPVAARRTGTAHRSVPRDRAGGQPGAGGRRGDGRGGAAGRADLGIATIGTTSPIPPGLVGDVLLEEGYALVHPAGHAAPRSLPLVDWTENCTSYTRSWWAEQEWIPAASVRAEDDGAVLSMVSSGFGMAIMPELSLVGAPPTIEITDLGPERPTRSVGYVTTPELAGTVAVRGLIRELRALRPRPVAQSRAPRPVAQSVAPQAVPQSVSARPVAQSVAPRSTRPQRPPAQPARPQPVGPPR